jgi:hypothetical protein
LNARRTVGVALILVVVLVVALLLWQRSGSDNQAGENVATTTTTFPEPPGGAGEVIEESEGTLNKTTFTTTDAPGAVLDSYLANFARIGWTTLSDERAGDTATLSLQGGNRYAAVRAVSENGTTTTVVCTGVDQGAVLACAQLGGDDATDQP